MPFLPYNSPLVPAVYGGVSGLAARIVPCVDPSCDQLLVEVKRHDGRLVVVLVTGLSMAEWQQITAASMIATILQTDARTNDLPPAKLLHFLHNWLAPRFAARGWATPVLAIEVDPENRSLYSYRAGEGPNIIEHRQGPLWQSVPVVWGSRVGMTGTGAAVGKTAEELFPRSRRVELLNNAGVLGCSRGVADGWHRDRAIRFQDDKDEGLFAALAALAPNAPAPAIVEGVIERLRIFAGWPDPNQAVRGVGDASVVGIRIKY